MWCKGGTWLLHKGGHSCGLRGNVRCGTNQGAWLWCMVVAQGGEHGCLVSGGAWLWHKEEGNMAVAQGGNMVVAQGGNMVVVQGGNKVVA